MLDHDLGERCGARLEAHAGELTGGQGGGRVHRLVAAGQGEPHLDAANGKPRTAVGLGLVALDAEITAFLAEARDTGGGHLREQWKELVIGIEHRQSFFRQRRDQLTFRPSDVFPRAEELDVDDPDVGHDPDRRFGERRQAGDIAGLLHPHLQHQPGVVGLEAQDGQGHARLRVQVALRVHDIEALREDGRDHLFGRRLAVAARHGHD